MPALLDRVRETMSTGCWAIEDTEPHATRHPRPTLMPHTLTHALYMQLPGYSTHTQGWSPFAHTILCLGQGCPPPSPNTQGPHTMPCPHLYAPPMPRKNASVPLDACMAYAATWSKHAHTWAGVPSPTPPCVLGEGVPRVSHLFTQVPHTMPWPHHNTPPTPLTHASFPLDACMAYESTWL